ncbi:MAG: hypothetical protein EVA26_01960 [Burkholderiaceae bacterium]|nr:MAG: hypothetical protein EVA26_01960 [Burkholderiaceae bacterium]
MGNHQVFNSGSIKSASEQKSSFSKLGEKTSGPAINNSLTSRFAAIDFGKIRRAFNKEYRVPKVELQVEEIDTGDYNEPVNMDSIINSALTQHEKRMKQNFLFDRIRAISSETKRINANIELGNKRS